MPDKKEKSPAGTVVDYLRWRGDLPLTCDAFNEVDNLVLCILSYLNYARFPELKTMDPTRAVELCELAGKMGPEDEQLGLSELSYLPVMALCGQSQRFGKAKMFGYVSEISEEQQTQFQAVSFLLPDDTVFIAYMGTDRSMAGWKEDFNMSFLAAVPAQEKGLAYARAILAAVPRKKVRIGGHSKGGNLAVWAATHLPKKVQDKRLLAVYNNDGPGFHKELWESEGCRNVAGKMYTFVPESSIVGMLLDHAEEYTVIDSVNRSLLQHEAMSWRCLGGQFIRLPQRSEVSRRGDAILREWLAGLSVSERQEFCDSLFQILSQNGKVKTLDDLRGAGAVEMLRSYATADEDKRRIITEIFRRLAEDVGEELRSAAETGISDAKKALGGLKTKRKEKP